MTYPETIDFNIVDRAFLIPETDDLTGTHFPMTIMSILPLREVPTVADVVRALHLLVERIPHLRLAYQLQPEKSRWIRVPETELESYLESLVRKIDADDIEALVSEHLEENITPISQPIQIIMANQHLVIRMHHSFGDGMFLFFFNQCLLTALFAQDKLDSLPEFSGWRYPMWKLIWRDMTMARTVFWKWLRSLAGIVDEPQLQVAEPPPAEKRRPIVSGVKQCATFRQVAIESLNTLKTIRDKLSEKKRLSMNTLLQILVAERLSEMGLVNLPTKYSIPLDLHRYLKNPHELFAGNLSSQVRVVLPPCDNWMERCHELQARIKAQLDGLMPMVGLPSEWLLALAGDKTYKSVNRDWLLKSIDTDTRFFVLSNLGDLDSMLGDFTDFIHTPNAVTPLMGAPPLVVGINTFQGCMNISLMYDPLVLDTQKIDEFCVMFSPQWLQEKLDFATSSNL